MQATGDAGSLERLLGGILLTGLHETWHLLLGQLNLSSAKGREVDVCNLHHHPSAIVLVGMRLFRAIACAYLELLCWLTHFDGV